MEVLTDKGIIEIFINDGRYVITNVVYSMNSFIDYKNIEGLEILEFEQ